MQRLKPILFSSMFAEECNILSALPEDHDARMQIENNPSNMDYYSILDPSIYKSRPLTILLLL